MARFNLNDAVISFLKTHDTWEAGSSHPSTFTCLREAVYTYDCMSKANPSLTPKSKERNLHTTQKQTQNVIASSKSYQKWNDEFKKFNKRETEKERSKESWRC